MFIHYLQLNIVTTPHQQRLLLHKASGDHDKKAQLGAMKISTDSWELNSKK